MIADLMAGVGGLDIVLTVVRVALGLFFAISGYHKLFNANRRKDFIATMRDENVPMLAFNVWFVPAVELAAGAALTVGLLTVLSALGLAAICCVAFAVDGVKKIRTWQPIDLADALDDVLYLPETLYALMLVLFVANGGGWLAMDALLF